MAGKPALLGVLTFLASFSTHVLVNAQDTVTLSPSVGGAIQLIIPSGRLTVWDDEPASAINGSATRPPTQHIKGAFEFDLPPLGLSVVSSATLNLVDGGSGGHGTDGNLHRMSWYLGDGRFDLSDWDPPRTTITTFETYRSLGPGQTGSAVYSVDVTDTVRRFYDAGNLSPVGFHFEPAAPINVIEGFKEDSRLVFETRPIECADVVEGAFLGTGRPQVRVGPGLRDSIHATFTPNFDLALSEAAQLCGVNHFNFRNRSKEPDAWEVKVNDQVVKAAGMSYPPGSFGELDPIPGGTYTSRDPRAISPIEATALYPPGQADDANDSYYNDNYVVQRWPLNLKELEFIDSPQAPALNFTYEAGEATEFFTELVGVDAAGAIVRQFHFENIPGTSFSWKTNQLSGNGTFPGMIWRSTLPDQPGLPEVLSGGIFDVRVVVPEPSSVMVFAIGVLCLLHRLRRRLVTG